MKTYSLAKLTANGGLDPSRPNKLVTQRTQPDRKGWLVVDSWPAWDQPPSTSDARAHQDWDRRNGRSG